MTASKQGSNPSSVQQVSLGSLGFVGLLLTQWLTIINDNAFRWLVVGIGKEYFPQQQNLILTLGLGLFVLPYLTLAAPAGYLADRFCKRQVIVGCKAAEIVVMGLGILAIWWGNVPCLFVVVLLMGAQSALFAPAKMGQLPEMLPAHQIASANGWFALVTFTATIIGMWIGGGLADLTEPYGQQQLWISAIVLVGIASVGTLFSFWIPGYPAANRSRRFPWRAHVELWRDLRLLAHHRSLLIVVIGIVFFWAVGAISQLNIDQFANESGTFFESERTPLLVSLVFGVGLGSVLAGSLSRGRIELGMLGYALLGLSLFSLSLAGLTRPFFNIGQPFNRDLILAMTLLMCMGASAGLFNVPLASFIQHRSPPEQRGSILSATNFCVFTGILLSAGLYSLMRLPVSPGSESRVLSAIDPQPAPEAYQAIQSQVRQFQADWHANPEDPPSLPEAVAAIPVGQRDYALAELMWEDLKFRREHGEQPVKEDYYADFHDSPTQLQIIKAVLRESVRRPLMTSHHVFLLLGLVTLPVALLTFRLLPQASVRFPLRLLLWGGRGARVTQADELEPQKAALLVVNRCSSFARLMLHLTSARPIREVHWQPRPAGSWSRRWQEFWGAIWIGDGPWSRQQGLATARKHLLRGGTLAVFQPRAGAVIDPKRRSELESLIGGIRVPLMSVFVNEPRVTDPRKGSFWSRLWASLRRPILIGYGPPRIADPQESDVLNRWTQSLGEQTMQESLTSSGRIPAIRFLEMCRRRGKRTKVADSMGQSLSGYDLLIRTLILRRLLRREVLQDDEQYVAVLLPPSVPAVVANAALAIDRRVPVNLNYTVTASTLNHCLEQCGIRHVLTSRKVMDKLKFDLDAEVYYLEDLKSKVRWTDKLAGFWGGRCQSLGGLIKHLGLDQARSEDVLTVIFTSGSTGVPKGVMLTNGNVAHNVEGIETVVRLHADDVLLGILPFFHSFGFTVSLWGVLNLELSGVYHFNPLDSKQVGKLCQQHRATCLLATPTFLRSYLRRCTPEQFSTLEVVVVGAEKLPQDLSNAFEERFHVRPAEGYGTTELTPLVSVNVPALRQDHESHAVAREGSVGLPIPGVTAKITDLETGKELGPNERGMLWIKGPNVMKGYLGRPDLTAEAVVDGWYKTGDVGYLDDDGFIFITGRESRFSKIGGEMVPHLIVEERLLELVPGDHAEGGYPLVVTSVPDEKKGERLVVLHVELPCTVDQMRAKLQASDLPPLFVPGADSFFQVDAIPVLGTGKLDLKGVKQKALELTGQADA